MLLTEDRIKKCIAPPAHNKGLKATTYNATVGEIICDGEKILDSKYILPSRGIVWVVSDEIFKIPDTVTGLATLKTTWTHDGVLALNVGVIDPGWEGPLATALVNFSNKSFPIQKGDEFFRILFNEHAKVTVKPKIKKSDDYIQDIEAKSKRFSAEFLNMDLLKREVANDIFQLPRLAVKIGVGALIATLFSIFIPIAYSVLTDTAQIRTKLELFDKEVQNLKKENEDLKQQLKSENDNFRKDLKQEYVTKDQLSLQLRK